MNAAEKEILEEFMRIANIEHRVPNHGIKTMLMVFSKILLDKEKNDRN